MNRKVNFRRLLLVLAIFLVYCFLAVLITWPLANNLTDVLPGASGDTLLHYWNGWAAKQAISQGQSPLFTNLIFYPQGVSLLTHNMAWFQILPWILLEPFVDGILAYNLVLLFNLALCGLTAYLLAKKLTGSLKAAFLAGLIYMAWPFRLSQLDHPNLLATQWIPLFLLFLILLLENGRWRDVIFTAISLALVGYSRWQLLIPAAVMGFIWVIWHWSLWWPGRQRARLLKLLSSGFLAGILLLPPAWLLLQEQQNDPGAADIFREGEESIMQADLLAYVTPSNDHFLLREMTTALYDRYYEIRFPTRRYAPYIGLTVLFLIALAVWKRRRDALPWLVMGLFLLLLALGPVLRVNGQSFPEFPMLYRFLQPMQLFRLMREPDRFNMFLALPVAVMASFGAAFIFSKSQQKWTARSAFGLITLLIMLEYLVIPVRLLETPEPSPFYDDLASEAGTFAVLNLPFDSLKAKDYMFDQVTHQKPLVQGNLSRIPPGAYETIDSNPWLNTLHHAVEMDPAYRDVSQQLSNLADQDIRYLILHKNLVGADRILHWQRYLLTQPVFEDEEIIVYRTQPQIKQDFFLDSEMVPGLGIVRVMTSGDCVSAGQTLEVDVGWGSHAGLSQDVLAELALVDPNGKRWLVENFPLSENFPASEWPANALYWGYYKLQIPEEISEGVQDLQLNLLDSSSGTQLGQAQTLGQIEVKRDPCRFDAIGGAQAINASFGDRLRLLAYEFEQDEHLDLWLYWQASQRMEKDYKIFVHVFDLQTAVPVAQDDAMPHRNAYPTRFWGLEEIVDDRIQISLQGVPAGTYGLALGVYDPTSGQRLEVVDSQGKIAPDGRLILPEMVIVR